MFKPIYNNFFPFLRWNWVARSLPRKKLLVEPPNDDWRSMMLSKGEIGLGSVNFIVNRMILTNLMEV
jgi:hypothetical protein